MNKRLLLLLFTALSLLPLYAYDFEVDGIYYNINSGTSTCSVTYRTTYNNSYSGDIVIPESVTYNGTEYTVTEIGVGAFDNCSGLRSVVIPNSVTSINESAFENCSGLTSVTIPNSITYIGDYAFENCSGLTSVTIPNSVTYIGDYAFRYCSKLTSITIPNSVIYIGYYAFSSCSGLIKSAYPNNLNNPFFSGTSIAYPTDAVLEDGVIYNNDKSTIYFAPITLSGEYKIPNSVTSINNYAFRNCLGITSVTIPNSVTSIGSYAFYGCSGLTSLTFNAVNCNSCGSSSYPAFPSTISSLTIGNEVTKIPAYFLYNGSKIESITIPNSVASIGSYAFRNCSKLTSITIPNSVNYIGEYAFSSCSGLIKSAYPNNLNNPFNYGTSIAYPTDAVLEDGVIYDNDKSKVYFAPITLSGEYEIPNFVTSIDSYAFYGCSGITSVTIPNSVTSIGESAFYGCSGITSLTFNAINCTSCGSSSYPAFPATISSLTIGNEVTNIPAYFLYNGSRIESVSVPNAVTTIGEYAFYNSTNLKSLTLGSGLLSIGKRAFSYTNDYNYYNIQIAKVFWLGNTPPANNGAVTALVNYVANDQYNLSNQVKYQFLSSKFLVEGTYYVPVSPSERTCDVIDCNYSPDNGNIEIPDKVTNRGVELKVLNINNYSFYKNQTATSLLANNNGSIGNSAFYDCDALNEIRIASKGNILTDAFYSCNSLETAVIDNIGSIGDQVFYGCSNLNNITLGDHITTIGNEVFYNCNSLPTITLPNNIRSIGEYIFYGCSKLATVNIGTGISSIPRYSFANCSVLNNLSIPNNVKAIGDYVFSGCRALAKLTLEDNEQEAEVPEAQTDITLKGDGIEIDNLQLGSNGSNPLFYDCPLDVVYIGRKLSYSTASYKGYSPFYRNTSLHSVEVTDAETQIYDNEFYGCTNLKTLKIGNGVKTIGKWAFSGCSSLDYFSAGYHVESIGEEAFSDCTGLTSYYSFSIEPPVCGNQALDDINKWDCTLFVPAESSDEYMAADQWKDFFFINETDAVLSESIRFNVESLDGKTGETFELVAEVLPKNATRKTLVWSTSDAFVVTVDEKGLLTFVNPGEATITAQTTDGSGVETSINVTVTVKEPELGDSNGNGTVNIADAVNTANYAIGNEVEHFNVTAADVNMDGIITLADASATIALILNQPVEESSAAKVRSFAKPETKRDVLMIDDFTAKPGETISIPVYISDNRDYTAMQADIILPIGLTLKEITLGNRAASHSLMSKRIDASTTRIALFNAGNNAFDESDEALIYLTIKAESASTSGIEIRRIIASDSQAKEYLITSVGGSNTDFSDIKVIESSDITIEPGTGTIRVFNAQGLNVAIHSIDGTTIRHFEAKSAQENYNVASGIYVVKVGTKIEKVAVK